MRSLGRAFRRGHATINQSDIFGPQVVVRNGRGNLQHLSGEKFEGRPKLPENWLMPEGRPSITENQRKKPQSIMDIDIMSYNGVYRRKGHKLMYMLN